MAYIKPNVSLHCSQMESEADYKSRALDYKNSKEYKRMIGLYTVLRNTIGECSQEDLVN